MPYSITKWVKGFKKLLFCTILLIFHKNWGGKHALGPIGVRL